MRNIGYSIFGKGPQRRRACYKKVYRKRPTELHEALCSFGLKDRTRRLSDEEFALQLWQEFGYLGGRCAKHFGDAVRTFGKLLKLIFS